MTGERGGGERDRDRERERERHRLRRGIVCSIQVSFSMNASLSQRDYKLFRAVIGSGPFLFFFKSSFVPHKETVPICF